LRRIPTQRNIAPIIYQETHMQARKQQIVSASVNSLFSSRQLSHHYIRLQLTEADLQRQKNHFEYLYDLKHTVSSDKIKIAEHYKIEKFPDAIGLLKDTISILNHEQAIKFTKQHLSLIKTKEDKQTIYSLLFDKNYSTKFDIAKSRLSRIHDSETLKLFSKSLEKKDRKDLEELYNQQQSTFKRKS
jgi:hypothetical protein